ncbi:hypothetical protein [Gordonia terrae]
MTVTASADSSPAAWLLEQERQWYDLTARGPLGFERYARLRFIPDPVFLGRKESEAHAPDLDEPGPSEIWQIGVAMTHLTRHTTTPDECYYLIWHGWPDVETLCERTEAARIDLTDEAQTPYPVLAHSNEKRTCDRTTLRCLAEDCRCMWSVSPPCRQQRPTVGV